jgi:hypothetical protein
MTANLGEEFNEARRQQRLAFTALVDRWPDYQEEIRATVSPQDAGIVDLLRIQLYLKEAQNLVKEALGNPRDLVAALGLKSEEKDQVRAIEAAVDHMRRQYKITPAELQAVELPFTDLRGHPTARRLFTPG